KLIAKGRPGVGQDIRTISTKEGSAHSAACVTLRRHNIDVNVKLRMLGFKASDEIVEDRSVRAAEPGEQIDVLSRLRQCRRAEERKPDPQRNACDFCTSGQIGSPPCTPRPLAEFLRSGCHRNDTIERKHLRMGVVKRTPT